MSNAFNSSAKSEAVTPFNKPDQIADRVRDQITRGTLAPGVHLGQTEIAEMCGASRVPVREALKLLAAEGIVIHDPNRGFFVASLSSDEARQLYRLRHLLEAEILSSIEWPSDLQLKKFHRQVEEIEDSWQTRNMTEWAMRHRAFRRDVFELSNEKFLVREAMRLWALAERYRSLLATASDRIFRRKGQSTDRLLFEALSEKDRQRLLSVFNEVRAHILEDLTGVLKARGL